MVTTKTVCSKNVRILYAAFNKQSARFDVLMAVFLKITAVWVQGHANLIQVAINMAPYPGIPQCSSITIYNRGHQAINL